MLAQDSEARPLRKNSVGEDPEARVAWRSGVDLQDAYWSFCDQGQGDALYNA